jgi:hypothetical protein
VSTDDRGADEIESGPPEEVRFGSTGSRPTIGRTALVAGFVALVVVALIARSGSSSTSPTPRPTPVAAATPSLPLPVAAPPRGPARAAPQVTSEIKQQLLGIKAPWDLFGRAPGVVIRIDFARGIVTRTAVPTLQSSGPVSFVAGPQGAVIRPLDFVPGYLVPDGHFARPLPTALRKGGPVVPGPRPGQFWVYSFGAHPKMRLIARDGHATGATIRLPTLGLIELESDDRGYLLESRTNGVFDLRPGTSRRLTTGHLLAIGPDGLLTVECATKNHCVNALVDQSTGTRRVLPRLVDGDAKAPPGVISPDGTIAALPARAAAAAVTLRLVNLVTGTNTHIDVHVWAQGAFGSTVVWSPHNKWLFVASARGELVAVNARTGRTRRLRVAPPRIEQLAIRAAPEVRRLRSHAARSAAARR